MNLTLKAREEISIAKQPHTNITVTTDGWTRDVSVPGRNPDAKAIKQAIVAYMRAMKLSVDDPAPQETTIEITAADMAAE